MFKVLVHLLEAECKKKKSYAHLAAHVARRVGGVARVRVLLARRARRRGPGHRCEYTQMLPDNFTTHTIEDYF